ncbi:hypothetical protein GGR58DRAFT_307653 [Xylaria digitata]|nr:hypothetical protein GGR58DRAFT_307653 [Xylaria digitata]
MPICTWVQTDTDRQTDNLGPNQTRGALHTYISTLPSSIISSYPILSYPILSHPSCPLPSPPLPTHLIKSHPHPHTPTPRHPSPPPSPSHTPTRPPPPPRNPPCLLACHSLPRSATLATVWFRSRASFLTTSSCGLLCSSNYIKTRRSAGTAFLHVPSRRRDADDAV